MSIFLEFFRSFLLWSKKHSFLSRISKNVSFWLFFAQKKHMRKMSIFWQKSWKKPWKKTMQNVDFFRLFENFTFEVQKALFSIYNIRKCFFLAFLAKKKHIRKRSIFWQKPWTNPQLQNVDSLEFFRTFLFRSKKHSFLSKTSKNVSFRFFFAQKKNTWEKSRFFEKKPWTNLFAKCRFFRLC